MWEYIHTSMSRYISVHMDVLCRAYACGDHTSMSVYMIVCVHDCTCVCVTGPIRVGVYTSMSVYITIRIDVYRGPISVGVYVYTYT